jgi:hypothetical protein
MNDRFARSALAAAALALALAALLPTPANAQTRPARQRVLSRGAADPVRLHPFDAKRTADRLLYGRIDAMHGVMLAVRARSGRTLRVDATEALRTDTFSQPLFVGKIVVIGGYYDTARTLHAKSIMAMQSLDAGTAPDR